jgi:argininosuccinate synthase
MSASSRELLASTPSVIFNSGRELDSGDGLSRWLAPSITGSVEVELRRGDDWMFLDARAPAHGLRAREAVDGAGVEDPAFTPEDRIGALELQNLSVSDNRELLLHHLKSLRELGAGVGAPELASLLGSGDKDE